VNRLFLHLLVWVLISLRGSHDVRPILLRGLRPSLRCSFARSRLREAGSMMADYIGPNGEQYSTNSIRARISRDAQEAADRIIAQHEEEQEQS